MRTTLGALGIAAATGAIAIVLVACTNFAAQDGSASTEAGAEAAALVNDAAPDAAALDAASDASAEADVRPPDGCSDGTREAFPTATFPGIAACSGAWNVAGIFASGVPSCARASGNDGTNKSGAGCSAQDLCAAGWHVCLGAADVATHGGSANDGPCAPPVTSGTTFYATAHPSDGVASCIAATQGFNDVFGCGDVGEPPSGDCAPLNKTSSGAPLPFFALGSDDKQERKNVTKGQGPGGVLCCAD